MSAADGRLIPSFFAAANASLPLPIHGTGLQTRSMTYVDDALELLHLVMRTTFPELTPVNIGNDDERSVLDIAAAFATAAERALEVTYLPGRPADPQRRRPDLARARSLGWEPRTTLESGLRITFAWFRDESLSYV